MTEGWEPFERDQLRPWLRKCLLLRSECWTKGSSVDFGLNFGLSLFHCVRLKYHSLADVFPHFL